MINRDILLDLLHYTIFVNLLLVVSIIYDVTVTLKTKMKVSKLSTLSNFGATLYTR